MRTHCPGPRVEDSESRILGSAIWIEFHKMHIYANVRFSIYTYKQYYVNSWYETSICTHIQRERVTEGDAIRSHGNAHSARHVRPMCTCIAAISIISYVLPRGELSVGWLLSQMGGSRGRQRYRVRMGLQCVAACELRILQQGGDYRSCTQLIVFVSSVTCILPLSPGSCQGPG